MVFKKGKAKTGGRQKGVKNKKTHLKEALATENFDVIKEFIKVYNSDLEPRDKVRLQALLDLLPYVVPRLKEFETEPDAEDIIDEELLSDAKVLELLKK